jgi:inner membrane protein
MDTVTQALLGATVGQAGFVHKLGRRAIWWGAVGGLLPDLDILAIVTHGPFAEFRFHRGITHAIWVGPVVGPLLGYAVWSFYRRGRTGKDPGPLSAWMGLFTLALFTHPLIDIFTSYGTQLFAPFSITRVAWNGISIIDPLYSGLLVSGLVAGRLARGHPRLPRRFAAAALAFSSAYALYGGWLNLEAERDVRAVLSAEGHPDARVRAYPTIFQPYLRRVVARVDDEVRVGFYTPFRPGEPVWQSFTPSQHPLIEALESTPEGALFVWFAMDEVTGRVVESPRGSVVELEDLRYGYPGRPDQGIWGIRAVFDGEGRLLEPVRRFNRRRDGLRFGAGDLWRGIWGDFSGFGLEPVQEPGESG